MSKTIVVFGASGTIGQGFIKATLEKGGIKIVGVFRSEESAKKVLTRLGNPAEDKFVSIIGNVGSEQNAADLQKKILAKVGTITDVVATIGGFALKTQLLQQTVEELRKDIFDDKFQPHFLVAKYFLPLIQDREGTSYTIINGASAHAPVPLPNFGHLTIASGALLKLAQVIMAEHKDKPVRINEFAISCSVTPWDDPSTPDPSFPHCNNIEMGKGLLGLVLHPNSKGESMVVVPDNLKRLTENGTLH